MITAGSLFRIFADCGDSLEKVCFFDYLFHEVRSLYNRNDMITQQRVVNDL